MNSQKTQKFPKKILLLSPVPPCSNYSGGLVLEHLARFLPKGSLFCFALMDRVLEPQIPPELQWMPVEFYHKPNEGWPKFKFMIGPTISFLGETYIRIFITRKIIKKIVAFGIKHNVDCLWAVLENQTMIRIAAKAARKLKVPLLTEVWDPPEWSLKFNNLDKIYNKVVLKQFAKTMYLSRKCGAASWAMAKKYHQDYGVIAIPFLPSLKASLVLPPATRPHARKELIIAVAGQLYSKDEWNGLVEALHLVNWRIGNRQVKIRLLGNWMGLEKVYKKMNIEYLGYQSQKDTLKLMNDSDILYCPYMFDPDYKKISELSFPSKLTTYLASGRPVFFHGPSYASPGIFLKENNAGLLCHTLDSKKIIKLLTELVVNQKLYASLSFNGHQAFLKYLTKEILHQNFSQFLDVPEKELLPVK